MQKAIRPEQKRVLKSLVCERLSASPDNLPILNKFVQSLGFCPQKDLGTSKPWYDWTCTFMSLDITKIAALRKKYFSIFNSDKLPFEYADLDDLFLS